MSWDGAYELTPAQIARLRERGHVLLRGVLSREEIAMCRSFLREYVLAKQTVLVGIASATPAADFNLGNAPAPVAEFVMSPRLAGIAAQLLGVPAVRILHFCGLFKPAHAAATPWHQDMTYVPLDTEQVISVWFPLTDCSAEMGDLVFADGSHHDGPLDPSAHDRYPQAHNGSMAAGDMSYHLGWVLHAAGANASNAPREAFGIGYYVDGARIAARAPAPFVQDFLDRYFPSLVPGAPAIGPLNPVVYSSTP